MLILKSKISLMSVWLDELWRMLVR